VSRAAEPTAKPAELPLQGGSENATLTLRPLLSAEMLSPPGWFHRGQGPAAGLRALGFGVPARELISVPIVAFLLEHPTAGLILVDTGFHSSIAAGSGVERGRNLGPIGRVMARGVRMRAEQAVAAQLRALGVEPADVRLVVMTHLHFDHASALCEFPGATVLVSEPEWQAARSSRSFLHGYSTAQLDPRPSYRTIDFHAPPARSHGPFEHAIDLFGDRSLILASTPGHSLGHMSLLVRLAEREALLMGDAAYTMQTLREGERPWRSEDSTAFEGSLRALQAFDREHPGALIVPGHDADAWGALQELYV
jgi:N-acyl homoserine lactone hydrolase